MLILTHLWVTVKAKWPGMLAGDVTRRPQLTLIPLQLWAYPPQRFQIELNRKDVVTSRKTRFDSYWYVTVVMTAIFQFQRDIFNKVRKRLFAKNGYSIALLARGAKVVDVLASEINAQGGHVSHLWITNLQYSDCNPPLAMNRPHRSPFLGIRMKTWRPHGALSMHNSPSRNTPSARPYSTSNMVFENPSLKSRPKNFRIPSERWWLRPFRSLVARSLRSKIELEEPIGKRSTLMFTGAPVATRGDIVTSTFAVGEFGVRALAELGEGVWEREYKCRTCKPLAFLNYPFSEYLIVHYRQRFIIISFWFIVACLPFSLAILVDT